jgi:hypothetical protein
MKICIIGNSHVGALKRAWDIEPHPSIDVDFLAARGASLRDLTVKRGTLVPATRSLKKALKFTSGGKSRINPKHYHCFLIYGAQAKHLIINQDNHYSQAVIRQTLHDHVQNTVSFEIITKLRSITDKKIYLGHHPLIAAEGTIEKKPPDAYLEGIQELNRHVYNPLNCELLPQPTETIVNGYYTDPVYTQGSKRLSVGNRRDNLPHSEDDRTHMNEQFGKIWLQAFFKGSEVYRFT